MNERRWHRSRNDRETIKTVPHVWAEKVLSMTIRLSEIPFAYHLPRPNWFVIREWIEGTLTRNHRCPALTKLVDNRPLCGSGPLSLRFGSRENSIEQADDGRDEHYHAAADHHDEQDRTQNCGDGRNRQGNQAHDQNDQSHLQPEDRTLESLNAFLVR